jgi:transcriptional regulator with XRE-family HTH domain
MSMSGNKNKPNNHLWLARKRLGLHQKQVAHLLGHKTTDQVCRYETGLRLPGLKLFLQFEVIYGLPARVLYREFYEEIRKEIETRALPLKSISSVYAVSTMGDGLFSEFCAYEELLRNPNRSKAEDDRIRKHIITVNNRQQGFPSSLRSSII